MKRTQLGVGAKSLERGSTFGATRRPLRRVVILGDRASKPSRPQVPRDARDQALARSHGRCIVCGDPAVQAHHVLPRSKFPHLVRVTDNLVGVCVADHANHESAFARIPRELLPAVTLALAEREGLTWYIERTYPAPSEAA